MKQIILIAMLLGGSCSAGDLPGQIQPGIIPQQQVMHLMAIGIVANNPIPVMEKKQRHKKYPRQHNDIQQVPRNQKFPKQKNIHRRTQK